MQAPRRVRMATRNGSAALRHDTGELTPGGKADVILVETRQPDVHPAAAGRSSAHLYSHLVFAANGVAVDTTIVDGQILMARPGTAHHGRAGDPGEANAGFLRTLKDPFSPGIACQIDAHTHILSLAEDAEFTTEYGREGSLCIYR